MKRIILVVNYEGEGNPRLCQNSRDSIMNAVARWGCEFIELNHNTLPLTVAPAAAKTQLFTDVDADEALVLDSDVIIREDTPSPFEFFPKDCMTVIENVVTHRRQGEYTQIKFLERDEWSRVENEFGPAPYIAEKYFNSGVMLVRKNLHEDIFKMALKMHKRCCEINLGLGWVDQTLFNYATAKLNIKMNYADEEWNFVWSNQLPDYYNMKKYIYHFAGDPSRNQELPKINWRIF